MSENPALFLASRQKRLNFWLDRFKAENLSDSRKADINALLKRYASTINDAARTTDEAERHKLTDDLNGIDRELTGVYESRRLLTSKLGIAAATDYSARGQGGSCKP